MTEKKEAAVDQLAAWIGMYKAAVANANGWQEVADRAKHNITDTLGDAEVGLVDGEPAVRWTTVASSRLDTKKLRAEHPELVDQFTVPSTTRRFTLVGPKDTP